MCFVLFFYCVQQYQPPWVQKGADNFDDEEEEDPYAGTLNRGRLPVSPGRPAARRPSQVVVVCACLISASNMLTGLFAPADMQFLAFIVACFIESVYEQA